MNYELHYNALIAKRIKTPASTLGVYNEIHHIVPKCMGGNDDDNNLVSLTAKEHYMAHVLLCKIHPNNAPLLYAWNMMSNMNSNKCKHNIRSYQAYKYKSLREAFALQCSQKRTGHKHSLETKQKMSASAMGRSSKLKGRTYEEIHGENAAELKLARSNSAKARTDYNSPSRRAKLSARIISDEWKQKNSDSKRGRRLFNNGSITKLIQPEEIQAYLDLGWFPGRHKL